MLTDQFGRKISYLRISITDRCNLRCRYCIPAEGVPLKKHEDLLTFEEIAAIVEAGASFGINKVRLTGGEPLVRRGAVDLARMLAAIDGVKDLSLTSNGLLLVQFADDLKRAGLMRVNISLDTLKAERFAYMTGADAWQRVIDGIEAARNAGFEQVKLNVVAIRGYNDDEIGDFVRFARDKALHLRFIEFMPVGNSFWEPGKVVSSKNAKLIAGRAAVLVPAAHGDKETVVELYQIQGSAATAGFISPLSDKFCHRCNRLRLTADGFLKPCLACRNEINIKASVRKGRRGPELKRVFFEALRLKPRGHAMDSGTAETKRCMAEVGG
ncbi:MAG: GTP 3',8-cyclase MoaA [Candidatus Edwardsbacteria bacterium]|nr:GTP 3',8-cyclase MoaA [Candidatus Edwardsbacteria bacterium]